MTTMLDRLIRGMKADISRATLQRGSHIDSLPSQGQLPALHDAPVLVDPGERWVSLRVLVGTDAFKKRYWRAGNVLRPEDHVEVKAHTRRWPGT